MATLYIVGTPIGNLEDLTFRAKRILSSVKLVACEDTRVTRKLLSHYQINVPTMSLHQHSDPAKIEHVMSQVMKGEDVAYVTDAGMPVIADPGNKLVQAAREYNVPIEVVPGPTALTSALSISGFSADNFVFLGFLPHKKGRQTLFKKIAELENTVVLYESPHRLIKTLESLVGVIPDRELVVCRELTKMYESTIRGTPSEVLSHFHQHEDEVRGEIVIVIGPML